MSCSPPLQVDRTFAFASGDTGPPGETVAAEFVGNVGGRSSDESEHPNSQVFFFSWKETHPSNA